VFEIIKAGGFIMWPIIACSIIALGIVVERFWTLKRTKILPPNLVNQVQEWVKNGELDDTRIRAVYESSPLGRVLAAGLVNRSYDRQIIKEALEDAGRHVAPDLDRFLRTLGTIANISPFLGLLGTVVGMIEMFSGIGGRGVSDPSIVAGGISQALIATAAGLVVAIPSVLFYRYLRGLVNDLLIEMEREALRLVDILRGVRAGVAR
jgi:biopolymer transport protein ExbB